MNETLIYKNWFQRNKVLLISAFIVLLLLVFSLPKSFTTGAKHILIGYSDTKLIDSSISIATKNMRVNEMLGDLKPMDKLTLLEGYISYSKNLDSVFMALTVKGTQGKGKLDIYASKSNATWKYDSLTVRLKEPKFRK